MSHKVKPGGSHSHSPSEPVSAQAAEPALWVSSHRPGLFPEKYFRWRTGEITRLEAFCDVVFGFALTLLVVSLEVPHTYAELVDDMRGFLPFAVCFAQLVVIWNVHYKFSRRYGLEDTYTRVLNLLLLFVVLFYVYPLKFLFTLLFSQVTGGRSMGLATNHDASMLMFIYGLGFAAVYVLFALMYKHAYALRRPLELNEIEESETRSSLQQCVAMALFGLVSASLAFKAPALSGWMYAGIGLFFYLHGTITGPSRRRLAERMGIR